MFTKKIYSLILMAGIFMSCTATQKLQLETYKLSNGLSIVLAPTHSNFTTVSVQYHVGGANENDNQLGLSHLLEHLMFKTSKNLKTGEFNSILEKELGGVFNAMTTYDSTIYHETVPSEHTSRVLELEAERMVNLTLVPEEVAKEKLVVLEEMRNRVENSDIGFMFDKASPLFFQDYPYGRDLGGKINIVDMTDKTIKDYYHHHYAPNNATLIITGKIPDNIKSEIERVFGALKNVTIQAKTTPTDFIPGKGSFNIKRPVQMNYVMLMTKMPAAKDKLIPGFNILSNLLTGGYTAPLVKKLSQEESLVSNISAMADISAMPNAFMIIFTPYKKTDIPKIIERINEILLEVKNSPNLEQEIHKNHLGMATDYYNSLQDTADLAVSIAQGVSLGEKPDFLISLQTDAVSTPTVQKAIDHILENEWTVFTMLREQEDN